jgi:hypothetical protein
VTSGKDCICPRVHMGWCAYWTRSFIIGFLRQLPFHLIEDGLFMFDVLQGLHQFKQFMRPF